MLVKIWTFFQNFSQSSLSVLKVILLSKFWLKSNKVDSKTVVLMGNGPSFNQSYEKYGALINKSETLAVNGFSRSELYEVIQPRYYIIGGQELWKEGLGQYFDDFALPVIDGILEKTTWDMYVFVEHKAKNSPRIKRISEHPKITVLYYNPTPIEGFDFVNRFFFKRGLGMPRPHNVLVPGIMCCIRMGYKKLIVLGADHSWHEELTVDENNNVMLNHEHFYDKNPHRDNMKLKAGRNRLIHEIFHKWMLSFKGYIEIEKYASKIGVKIYNSSEKSYIDGFERKEFKEAINE